jgi:hypothetical protein
MTAAAIAKYVRRIADLLPWEHFSKAELICTADSAGGILLYARISILAGVDP